MAQDLGCSFERIFWPCLVKTTKQALFSSLIPEKNLNCIYLYLHANEHNDSGNRTARQRPACSLLYITHKSMPARNIRLLYNFV